MKSNTNRIILIFAIIIVNIGIDQVTKVMARKQIEYNERIEVIGDSLILTKVENSGAFLGMGSNLSPILKSILLLGLPGIVMLGLLVYLIVNKELTTIAIVGLSFIVGGGIGNLYDRILYGSVTDMVHIDLGLFRTGIFNAADVSVMIGTGLVLLEQFLTRNDHKKVKEAAKS
ncbi:signal peptidase II [Roseivirga echinicomitans]